MSSPREKGRGLPALLAAVVTRSAARPLWVLVLATAFALAGLAYTASELGIQSDVDNLFDERLPFRQRRAALERAFPVLIDPALVVIDGESVSLARAGGRRLAEQLRGEPSLFESVYTPGAGDYFDRNGLLYLETDELDDLVDDLALAQPFLAEISRDGSLRGFFELLTRAIDRAEDVRSFEWSDTFPRLEDAVSSAARLRPRPVAFDELVFDPGGGVSKPRAYIVVQPTRDFTDLVPARAGMKRLRERVDALNADRRLGVHARITGDLALQVEELEVVRGQAARAGVLSFVLVSLILGASLRSVRLALGTVVTLVFGLVWTATFAALAIGHLNMISVAFAVLFIGLGVDFGIHFCLRYRELREGGAAHQDALERTARSVGPSLGLCAFTTAIGFYAFFPTGYAGVAELGVIAGTGMFVSVAATLTVLPAFLSLGVSRLGAPASRSRLPDLALPSFPVRHARLVVGVTAVLACFAAVLAVRLEFDPNTLRVRDPDMESVRAFDELVAEGDINPWSAELLAPDLASAEALARRLEDLAGVDRALTLRSYVPTEQEPKLERIGDAALMFDLEGLRAVDPPTPAETRDAIRGFAEALDRLRDDGTVPALASQAEALRTSLLAFLEGPGSENGDPETLPVLEQSLVDPVLADIAELLTSLEAGPVDLEDLPADLKERLLAPDGRARIVVYPRDNLNDNVALDAFVGGLQDVDPEVTGAAVYMVETARLIVRALQQAFGYALVLITLLLVVLWRRPREVLLVLLPLTLSALLTAAGAVALGLPLNFADVIVLPLLLGIGVDSGIHLVHRHRRSPNEPVLDTSTSRAVVWSALTTIASFGSLGLSTHRGMASLGQFLTLGVTLTLAANLIVLPALIRLSGPRARSGS